MVQIIAFMEQRGKQIHLGLIILVFIPTSECIISNFRLAFHSDDVIKMT